MGLVDMGFSQVDVDLTWPHVNVKQKKLMLIFGHVNINNNWYLISTSTIILHLMLTFKLTSTNVWKLLYKIIYLQNRIWDFATLDFLSNFDGHRGPITSLRFRQAESLEMYSSSRDRTIMVNISHVLSNFTR
jgi:hypothetical protein